MGLDKLIPITLYLTIIFFSDLFNKCIETPQSSDKSSVSEKKPNEIKVIISCIVLFFVWLAILSELICLAGGHGLSVDDSFNSKAFCVGANLFLFFYALFMARYYQKDETNKTISPEAQPYKMLQYLSIYQFIFCLYFIVVDSFGFSEDLREQYLYVYYDYSILLLLFYILCLLSERILDIIRILVSLFKGEVKKLETPFFISIIAASPTLKGSIIKTIEVISGVDLSKSEIADYISAQIKPVSILALLIFWIISSVVIVPPEKEAVFYRFGRLSGTQSYKPGLHFKYPWPFEKMELYTPKQIKTINIGFEPDPDMKHIIWTKSHASKNFYLLVGNGVEIIAVDCQVFFNVKDLYKYVTKVQNPEAYIENLAYKYLTANTISKTFDQIMSQNRNILIADLKKKIQEDLDNNDLGINIVDIVFLAIHPPLEVADAYEDVISSQRDKQTMILKAKSESIKEISMKTAFAKDEVNKAKGYAETTVANALGEAISFQRQILGYNTEPSLEEFRLRLDSIKKMAKSKNLYVIDKTFMRKRDRIILNLQN